MFSKVIAAALRMLTPGSAGGRGPFDDPLSAKAIREEAARRLRDDPNAASVEFVGRNRLMVTGRGGTLCEIGFGNVLRSMKSETMAERLERFDEHLAVVREALEPAETTPSYENLYLNVYTTEMAPGGRDGEIDIQPREAICAGFWALLVHDAGSFAMTVGGDKLAEAGLDPDVALRRARMNMEALAMNLSMSGAGPVWEIHLDGHYEPAMMLVHDLWPKIAELIGGTPVIAIPARGRLLVARAEDREGRRELGRRAAEAFENEPRAITDALFFWNGSGWDLS